MNFKTGITILLVLFAVCSLYIKSLFLDEYWAHWNLFYFYFPIVIPITLPIKQLTIFLKYGLLLIFLSIPFFGFHTWHIQNIFWEFFLCVLIYSLGILSLKKGGGFDKFQFQWILSFCFFTGFFAISTLQLPMLELKNLFFTQGIKKGLITMQFLDASTFAYPFIQSSRIVLLSILAYLTAQFIQDNKWITPLILALFISFLISVLISILDFLKFISIDWIPHPYTRSSSFDTTYGNYTWFAQILTGCLPLFFLVKPHYELKKIYPFTISITVFCLFLLFSSARAALLIMPISIIGCILITQIDRNNLKKLFIKFILLISAFVLIAWMFFMVVRNSENPALSEIKSKLSNFSQSERSIIWKNALQIFGLSPLSGSGQSSYRYIDLSLTKLSNLNNSPQIFNHYGRWYNDTPHNSFFEILTGSGILGLLLVICHFLLLFINIYKSKIPNKEQIYLCAFSGIVFILYSLLQELFYLSSISFLWFFSICLCWQKMQNHIVTIPWTRFLFKGQIIIFIIGIISVAFNLDGAAIFKHYPEKIVAKFKQPKQQGLYDAEIWETGKIQWTNKGMIYPTKIESDYVKIKLQSMNANTPKNKGLKVLFYINDEIIHKDFLTREKLIKEFTLDVSNYKRKNVLFKIRVNKTFNPSKRDKSNLDNRNLGVVIHRQNPDSILTAL